MPELIYSDTGERVHVSDSEASELVKSGAYTFAEGERIAVEGPMGLDTVVDPALQGGQRALTPEERARATQAANVEAAYGDEGLAAGLEGFASGVTLGASDLVQRALTDDDPLARRAITGRAEANPVARTIGEVGGAVAPALVTGGIAAPSGALARAGSAVARRGAGRGLGGRLAASAAGGALEGAGQGVAAGVRELALDEEPITAERIVATVPRHMLFGAVTGGAASAAITGTGAVIRGGARKLGELADDAAAKAGQQGDEFADLAKLDRKGLREAKQAEMERLRAARDVDRVQLRQARDEELQRLREQRAQDVARAGDENAVKRAAIADEIAAFRQAGKDRKPWLLTSDKDLKAGALADDKDIGKVLIKADKALDRVTDNVKGLRQNPRRALDALQRSEQALERLQGKADAIRQQLSAAGRSEGVRAQALASVDELLEQNRALQQRIAQAYEAPAPAPPLASERLTALEDARDVLPALTSPRLTAIAAAQDALSGGKGLTQQLAEGATYSAVTAAASPLGPLAPILGARAASAVGNISLGRVAQHATDAGARIAKAVEALTSRPSARAARATKSASVAALQSPLSSQPAPTGKTLADAYLAREAEIRERTEPGPDGNYRMATSARRELAGQLDGLRGTHPVLADQVESVGARIVEYLAAALPKRPDYLASSLGPARWQPSDLEMRAFGRRAAAAHDPLAAVERAADGNIGPEEAETLRAVYPEIYEDMRLQLMERAAALKESLPYQRRLALSILFDVPLDPALRPEILRQLQASFSAEPDTGGGAHPPTPQPQYGSISRPEPTTAQERAG